MNVEASLTPAALELITHQVWDEYALYTCDQGINEVGFRQIYASGVANVVRDHEYVVKAYKQTEPRKPDRAVSCVVHTENVTGKHMKVTKAMVERALLEKALPDAVKTVLVDDGVETHPGGRAFGVSCMFCRRCISR